MKKGQPSRTAEYNALFRSIENRRPSHEQLFTDPDAYRFLSRPLALIDRACAFTPARNAIAGRIDRRWPGVRTSVAARTKLIDELITTIAPHVDQLVLLGAGFDTRATRLGCTADLTVFEVDHPDTQRRKRETIGPAGNQVHYISTDFNLQQLEIDMRAAGHSNEAPTLILWEGASNYVSPEAASATFTWCANAAADSHIIFTYVDEQVLSNPEQYHGADRLHDSLAKSDEPLTFGIAPADTPNYLREHGLDLVRNWNATEYRTLAYGYAAAEMRGHEFYQVAHARPIPKEE